MNDLIRPAYTVVLRLWREPGAPQGDAGWRGQLRPLETRDIPAQEIVFSDLTNLTPTIRDLLDKVSPTQ